MAPASSKSSKSGRSPAVAKNSGVFVSCAGRLVALLSAAVVIGVHAADNQGFDLQYNSEIIPIESPPGESFGERFKMAYARRAGDLFADRLGPLNLMHWGLELANNK